MPVKKLKDFLDSHGIKYVSIIHSPAYTTMEIAALTHVPGKELAKTVMVKIDGTMNMVVLPSSYKVDFKLLKEAFGTQKVELATEDEFESRFSDCDLGAMPPFGNLYNMDVYVAEKLTEDTQIAFNAGMHTELIKMDYLDFKNLVNPKVLKVAIPV